MAIVILDVPQAEEDNHEMNDEDWLKLATSEQIEPTRHPHGCASTDGIRIHLSVYSGDCICGNKKFHKSLNKVIELASESAFVFRVNRRYLVEALSGINPENDVLCFFSSGPKTPIVIRDDEGSRAAVIMPIDSGEDEKNTLLRVTEHKEG